MALAVIVVTGTAVRLTASGLGCSDWPTCEEGQLIADFSLHPMIEFVNRVFTGFVAVAVIVAVLASLFRKPRRRDLTLLSWGLVAGVIGQIALGAVTVLTHLESMGSHEPFLAVDDLGGKRDRLARPSRL